MVTSKSIFTEFIIFNSNQAKLYNVELFTHDIHLVYTFSSTRSLLDSGKCGVLYGTTQGDSTNTLGHR